MRVWSRPRSTRETRGTFVLGRISTKYGCRIRVELLSYANIVNQRRYGSWACRYFCKVARNEFLDCGL